MRQEEQSSILDPIQESITYYYIVVQLLIAEIKAFQLVTNQPGLLVSCVCLHNISNQWTDLNKTLNVITGWTSTVQLVNICSHPDSRWLLQPIDLKHNNDYNSVTCAF